MRSGWVKLPDKTGPGKTWRQSRLRRPRQIHVVHFRNVSSPLPRFHETFPNDGYLDMYQVMETLREVGCTGCAVPDHIPKLAGDDGLQRAGLAYCIASMRTLLRRANQQAG